MVISDLVAMVPAQLSQTLHTGDELTEPALSTHITYRCDLKTPQKRSRFVARLFFETKLLKEFKKLPNQEAKSLSCHC